MTAPPAARRRTPRLGAACALAVAAVLLGCPGGTGRADQAAKSLAKYDKNVDDAIDRALKFIAGRQLKNGSFHSTGMPGNTAVTSLSVMAFLSKGHTPGAGPYGQAINRGIDYILASQMDNGMLIGKTGHSHGPMYAHCTSTLMLSEVSGMVDPPRQKEIDRVLSKALKVILAAQKIPKAGVHKGGWRYTLTSADSDISCTGWALMSLRSARNNGAPVPKEAIDNAVKYILGLRCSDGGFGYSGPSSPGLARTGTGLLCLELCGQHGHKATTGAGEWILAHLPTSFGAAYFYYGLYYSSQGMFQLGGKYWELWARHMYEMMLKFQQKDGSWPPGSTHAAQAGPCYATAMGVLAMSVSYRQLPIYQR